MVGHRSHSMALKAYAQSGELSQGMTQDGARSLMLISFHALFEQYIRSQNLGSAYQKETFC